MRSVLFSCVNRFLSGQVILLLSISKTSGVNQKIQMAKPSELTEHQTEIVLPVFQTTDDKIHFHKLLCQESAICSEISYSCPRKIHNFIWGTDRKHIFHYARQGESNSSKYLSKASTKPNVKLGGGKNNLICFSL